MDSIKIFLADDDADDRELFKEALVKSGIHARLLAAESAEKLMAMLSKGAAHIIFLDINMPGKNGIQCLKEIRANKSFNHVPVVILSTSNLKEDIEETFKNGAVLYIKKPNRFDDYTRFLHRIFSDDWMKLLKPDRSRYVYYAGQVVGIDFI